MPVRSRSPDDLDGRVGAGDALARPDLPAAAGLDLAVHGDVTLDDEELRLAAPATVAAGNDGRSGYANETR